MTQQHPITPPPPELVQKWMDDIYGELGQFVSSDDRDLAALAAQWGADQELEACCEWLEQKGFAFVDEIRTARRPKPPSLKEQALLQLDVLNADLSTHGLGCDLSQIRRALEQLDDN
jgi:hypothetical protein